MKKRGLKGGFSLENRLLPTLYHLRDYPKFLKLGQFFGISESYADRIYHRISDISIKILHVPDRKKLMDANLETVILDVSEQPLERPKKGRKDYYSGKKNNMPLRSSR